MADERLRELERRAAQGDDDARAQLIGTRLRLGDRALRRRVEQAAHLHDPVAAQIDPGALPKIKCTCGLLAKCSRCRGTGMYSLSDDLVPFVRQAEINPEILLAWVCDCAEHVLPLAAKIDREPLREIIGKARGRSPELRSLANAAQEGALANCMVNRAVQLLVSATAQQLANAVAHRAAGGGNWRTGFAGVVTCAYRAAGNTRAERDWQIASLTRRLLG